MNNILVDTGFWFAYLGTRQDSLHKEAIDIYDKFIAPGLAQILIPYPVLYETVNTKLLKDKNQEAADWFLKKLVSDPLYVRVADTKYRDIAFESTLKITRNRGVSLVDNILRIMLQDEMLKVQALITFNPGDFSDICFKERIQLIDQKYESDK